MAPARTLSEADRRIVAVWAADCAGRVPALYEAEAPHDARPRACIARTRAFAGGEQAPRMGSRLAESTRYVLHVAFDEKPEVLVPDGAPSYQLELDDVVVGDGDEAVAGRIVEVHYVGVSWSTQQQFDASWDRRDTFKFRLGRGDVIAGWDQGVAGMKVGGRRRITIPPMLGYGKRGAGRAIGPDETLVFVVDLISVR